MDLHFRWDDEDKEYEDFFNVTRAKRYTEPDPGEEGRRP